jgi:hypothetical protein
MEAEAGSGGLSTCATAVHACMPTRSAPLARRHCAAPCQRSALASTARPREVAKPHWGPAGRRARKRTLRRARSLRPAAPRPRRRSAPGARRSAPRPRSTWRCTRRSAATPPRRWARPRPRWALLPRRDATRRAGSQQLHPLPCVHNRVYGRTCEERLMRGGARSQLHVLAWREYLALIL